MLENIRIDKARSFIIDDIRRRVNEEFGEYILCDKVNKNKLYDICLKFRCKTEND